jgi:HTH-type transcriptional repressor of NAD biosynthesis genes
MVYEENGNKVELDDFIPISEGRQSIEDWLFLYSNRLLFCDTEDITTYIFSKMYFPDEYKKIEPYFEKILNQKPKYDLYILLKPDCKVIQDGTRNFLDERWEHYQNIKDELMERGCSFIEIGGDWENRLQDSIKMINIIFNIDEKKILPIQK